MIHESGQVVAVEDGVVWVDCVSRQQCQRCAEGRGCGGALLSRILGDRRYRVCARCDRDRPAVGDRVILSLHESAILRAAALAYLLPLLGLIAGAVIGQLAGSEPAAMAGAGAGFLLSWAAARILALHYVESLQPLARVR